MDDIRMDMVSHCLNFSHYEGSIMNRRGMGEYQGDQQIYIGVQVNLFTRCAMNWTMQDILESEMKVRTVDLKNCTKEMVVEYHNKTVYECREMIS